MNRFKPFVILGIILCLGVCLVHCDKDSGTNGNNDDPEATLVGTWVLTTVTIPDTEGGDDITVPASFAGIAMTVILHANGNVDITVDWGDGEDTETGTWTATATTLTMNLPGEAVVVPYTLTGNTLSLAIEMEMDWDEDGIEEEITMTLTFTKQ